MIRQLLCGCCTNGCACSAHAPDKKRFVCLSHRASSLRHISWGEFEQLSAEQLDSGCFVLDIEMMDPVKHAARRDRDFQRDADEDRDGTYR